jgi:hypothetical protein
MLHTQLAALALAAMATAASGCGSSKTGSATTAAATTTSAITSATATQPTKIATGAPLPRAQWIAKGDAICQGVQTKLETVHGRTSAQFSRALPQAGIYYAAEAESLSKLVPPKSMAHDWEQIVNDVHVFGEYTNVVVQNIKEHRVAFPNSLRAKVARIQANMIATAKRDGFKWCSIGE